MKSVAFFLESSFFFEREIHLHTHTHMDMMDLDIEVLGLMILFMRYLFPLNFFLSRLPPVVGAVGLGF